jgi:hypothetical protein
MPVRQVFFQVAEVVLAELCSRVAARLQNLGERDVLLLQTCWRTRRADGGQPRAYRQLTGDEGSTPSRAARLCVERAQPQSFVADSIDVGCLHAHDVAAIGGHIHLANVITEYHQDVGFAFFGLRCGGPGGNQDEQ